MNISDREHMIKGGKKKCEKTRKLVHEHFANFEKLIKISENIGFLNIIYKKNWNNIENRWSTDLKCDGASLTMKKWFWENHFKNLSE